MNLRLVRDTNLPLASVGLALIMIGLAMFQAHADAVLAGPCQRDAVQACDECTIIIAGATAISARPSIEVPFNSACTGPINVLPNYNGGTCSNTSNYTCSQGTLDCGRYYDCYTRQVYGPCGTIKVCNTAKQA